MSKVAATLTGHLTTDISLGDKVLFKTDASGKSTEVMSPTDVLASSLAACVASMMSFVSGRDNLDLTGVKVAVEKTMQQNPSRIASFKVTVYGTEGIPAAAHSKLEMAAKSCPVKQSLLADIKVEFNFVWV